MLSFSAPPPTRPRPPGAQRHFRPAHQADACAVEVFARQFPELGGTPCFRRPDEIPQGLAPGRDVSSGCRAESEVGTLRPLRLLSCRRCWPFRLWKRPEYWPCIIFDFLPLE
ncbi:Hypothetical predicted protein [Lynx pardinus]|uniref:Uncharacterized protein n=1 Tax=Lynx pardinus TaxID=191816 RepID=A0A485NG43_LYNPA|nr:Hypothetical predicted protein [Lynx pardinus]